MKILFIACYSPMINNSASIETLMYLNNLCNIEDNKVHLLTVNFPKNSIYYDEQVLSMLDSRVVIHSIDGGKIFNKLMPRKNSNTRLTTNSNENKKITILRKIKNKVIFPDMYFSWSKKASKYGINLMKKEGFDVIFSMHEPPSSHLCALKIKRKYKHIPWIAYWSDPWLMDSTRENIGFLRRFIEGFMEKSVVNIADKHLFVTESNREDYINRYGLSKKNTYVVTRGYDENLYKEIKVDEKPKMLIDDKINIVYTGEIFIKLRDIYPFINALKILERNNSELFNKLNILFFGNIDDINAKKQLESFSNVKVNGRIPYRDALSYTIHGDVLMLFGNKNSKQIPAKIYDYFGTNQCIWVISGDDKDPIIPLVKDNKKCILTENNKESIYEVFESLRGFLKDKERFEACDEFEWKNVSKKLNCILKSR